MNKLNPHTNSFTLLENYIPLAMAYIYARLRFGQAFLELNLFYLSCLHFLHCQAHEASRDLARGLFSSLFMQFKISNREVFCKEDV